MIANNNVTSRESWLRTKINCSLNPTECVWLALIFIKKQPSALVNPANQCGSIFWGCSTKGLFTWTTSGKKAAKFSLSDKPRLIEALLATILLKPSRVRCSRRSIIWLICINNSQSSHFFVFNGNLAKWFLIVLRSLAEKTLHCIDSDPCEDIFPTPRYCFSSIRIGLSLTCKTIDNPWRISQPCFKSFRWVIKTWKDPSPSTKPVTHQGSSCKSLYSVVEQLFFDVAE